MNLKYINSLEYDIHNGSNVHIVPVPLNYKSSTLGIMKEYKNHYPNVFLKYKKLIKENKAILGGSYHVKDKDGLNVVLMFMKRKFTDKLLYQHFINCLESAYTACLGMLDSNNISIFMKDLCYKTDISTYKKYIDLVFEDDPRFFINVYS